MILEARNLNLTSENQRLMYSRKNKRYFNNPKYSESNVELYYKLYMDLPKVFKKLKYDIGIIIEIETYKDIDNILKGLLDCLKKLEVIEDDREIMELYVKKIKIKRGQLDNLKIEIYGV